MEMKLHHVVPVLSVVFVCSHAILATTTSEEYWNSVLPSTEIPKSLKDLMHPPERLDNKGTAVGVSKGGGVRVRTPSTGVNVGHGGVGVNAGGGRTNVGVGKGGVNVRTRTKHGKPVYVGVSPGKNPFVYLYAATETQLKDDPNVALFFLPKDIYQGKKMNLHFPKTSSPASFLPREVADSIPFSSKKLPEIFDEFSVQHGSDQAEAIKKTIEECEEKGVEGEEKLCATSLESMVDFSVSKLGKNVEAISTSAEGKGRFDDDGELREYAITKVEKMTGAKATVACHREEYAYAVFYCHKTDKTVAYKVDMAAAGNGSKAKAVAVCHLDTAAWNPKHLAFQVLNVKPGAVPICHFLPDDHVLWVPKN